MSPGFRSDSEAPGFETPGAGDAGEHLVERASKGDRRAFASIFERYHQRLYRYCAAIVGDPEDARDALQNTMVSVLAALPGERRTLELEPWLYRIAHNEAIEVVRRRRPGVPLDSTELAGTAGTEESLETRERLRRLLADLRQLPERQRGALVMRELGGLGFEAIGEAFGTSAQAARQMIYEARVGLQDMEGGRAMPCDEVRRKLSDGDRRLLRRRDVRAHLRQCARCRDFEREIAGRRKDLAAIAPLPALAAGGILQALLGGGAAGGAGQGAAATGAGAVGKALGGSVLAKTVATGAVVVALGAFAADRSGLIGVGSGGGSGQEAPASSGAPAAPGSTLAPAQNGRSAATAGSSGGAGAAALAGRRAHRSVSDPPSGEAATEAGPQHGSSHAAQHTAPAGAKAKGVGTANAHGANPNANPHAAVKSNNGHHSEAVSNSGEHTRRHDPTTPKPTTSGEHPAKPEPPAKGQAAAPGQVAAPEHGGHGRTSPAEQPAEVAG